MTQSEAWKVIRGVIYDRESDLVDTLSFMRDNLPAFGADTRIAYHVLFGGLKKVIR